MSTMRMTEEQFGGLRVLLGEVIARNGMDAVMAYREGLKADPRVKDLDKRFRWDLFWSSVPSERNAWMNDCYLSGMNDSHIDTGLRRWAGERLPPPA